MLKDLVKTEINVKDNKIGIMRIGDVSIPIFYEQKETDKYGREGVYPILIPNLIQGCYNKKRVL